MTPPAGGCFPVANNRFQVARGKFKLPLLRGEVAPAIRHFRQYQRELAAGQAAARGWVGAVVGAAAAWQGAGALGGQPVLRHRPPAADAQRVVPVAMKLPSSPGFRPSAIMPFLANLF